MKYTLVVEKDKNELLNLVFVSSVFGKSSSRTGRISSSHFIIIMCN